MNKGKNYRKFLNTIEVGGTAYVAFKVEIYKDGAVSAEFSVRDCFKEATLEFYVNKGVRKGKPQI